MSTAIPTSLVPATAGVSGSPVVPAAAPPTPMLPERWTLADLLASLGDISPSRIRAVPAPGTATLDDAEKAESRYARLCELIDGVLVEKTMGHYARG